MPNLSSLFGRGKEQRDPDTGETPRERERREQMDREVIASLLHNGSNLAKPHRLEHHFLAERSELLAALAEDELAVDYEASEIQSLEDKRGATYWYFDLIKPTMTTEATVFAETRRMTILAQKYGVTYDGWGCLIEK